MDSNVTKHEQLGMPFGTAANRLKKLVLFDLLKRHGENVCFQCGKEILYAEQLSIEHKKPWLHVDAKLFWDLNNIAFSHNVCNGANSRHRVRGPISHGTHSGYSYRDCRCEDCRLAHNEYQKEWGIKQKKIFLPAIIGARNC